MRKTISFLKPYRRHLVIGPGFKLAEAILELILPLLIAHMIDAGIAGNDSGVIWRYGILCLLLALTGLGCATVCQYTASLASQGCGTDLRNTVFRKISSMQPQDIDDVGTSSLITRLNSDINVLQQAVAMLIRLVVRAPFLSIGGLIMAMSINMELSLILLLVLPLFIAIIFFIMTRTIPLYHKAQLMLDKLTRRILENLAGTRVIRAFARTEGEAGKFGQENNQIADILVKVGKIAGLLNPATTLILNGAVVAVLWFGAFKINTGSLSRGQMIALTNYVGQILVALVVVANLVILYSRAYASARRVDEVLNIGSDSRETREKTAAQDDKASWIEFSEVTFRYPDNSEPLFNKISFSLPRGSVTGIIGPTGSGKSSLAWLLVRAWQYDSGNIILAGRDITSYSQQELKQKISIVPQKAFLFSGTIAENLRLGCPGAADDELWHALRTTQAADFVSRLENGLETNLTRGGSNLSGGQRQRLTIARALVCQPELLILDDSTSALDYATEAALRQAISSDPQYEEMGLLIISQRVNAVRNAATILVIDNGKLTGIGNHENLVLENDLYREFWNTQTEKGEMEVLD